MLGLKLLVNGGVAIGADTSLVLKRTVPGFDAHWRRRDRAADRVVVAVRRGNAPAEDFELGADFVRVLADVEVALSKASPTQAKLVFRAPQEVRIVRLELLLADQARKAGVA